jgi:hypothetical protein
MLSPVDNRTIRSLGRRLSKGEATITKTGDLWIVTVGDESYCIPIEVRPSWKQFLPRKRRVVAVQTELPLPPESKRRRKKTVGQIVGEWIAKGWWWA